MNDNLTYVSNHNTYSCVYNTRYLIEWLQSLNIECVWDVIFHILVIINDIFQPSMFYYMYHYLNYMYVWLINVSLYLSYRHVSVNYKRWIYIYQQYYLFNFVIHNTIDGFVHYCYRSIPMVYFQLHMDYGTDMKDNFISVSYHNTCSRVYNTRYIYIFVINHIL